MRWSQFSGWCASTKPYPRVYVLSYTNYWNLTNGRCFQKLELCFLAYWISNYSFSLVTTGIIAILQLSTVLRYRRLSSLQMSHLVSIYCKHMETGIKGRDKWLYPTDTTGCNYLSLPLIPASGAQVPICALHRNEAQAHDRYHKTKFRQRSRLHYSDEFPWGVFFGIRLNDNYSVLVHVMVW